MMRSSEIVRFSRSDFPGNAKKGSSALGIHSESRQFHGSIGRIDRLFARRPSPSRPPVSLVGRRFDLRRGPSDMPGLESAQLAVRRRTFQRLPATRPAATVAALLDVADQSRVHRVIRISRTAPAGAAPGSVDASGLRAQAVSHPGG